MLCLLRYSDYKDYMLEKQFINQIFQMNATINHYQ